MAAKPFNFHMSNWQKAVLHNKGKCLFCFNTSAHNTGHKTHGFPIMKKVGLKFEPRSANTSTGVASCVATKGITPAPPTPPASTTNSDLAGSATVPGAFLASTKMETYDSGNKFDYERKCEGAMYCPSSKTNSNSIYSGIPTSCSHMYTEPPSRADTLVSFMGGKHHHPFPPPSCQLSILPPATLQCHPQGVWTICLSKKVLTLLNNPPAHSIPAFIDNCRIRTSLLVADTGATNHMIPNKSAFISYYSIKGRCVQMGNNSFAPILGHGLAIISINGKEVLICNCLHVPDLCNPLYILRAHQHQRGCSFIGMYGLGMYVFFSTFILEVDTATDCHLQYKPLGCSTGLPDLDYVQPKKANTRLAVVTVAPPTAPILVEFDNKDNPKFPAYATGATNHMIPNKSAFISYYSIKGRCVQMGNNSFAPILGHGLAIISLNGKEVLIRNCLHVPDLCNPLYILRAHQHQRGCSFIGMYGLGMYVFFSTFILEVDTATDCHLQYKPLGCSTGLPDLDYEWPKKANTRLAVVTVAPPTTPILVEFDNKDNPKFPSYASHYPKKPPSPPTVLYSLTNLSPLA
jgi:hypothetical protein